MYLDRLRAQTERYPHAAAFLRAVAPGASALSGAVALVEARGALAWRTLDTSIADMAAVFEQFASEPAGDVGAMVAALTARTAALPHDAEFTQLDEVIEHFYGQPIYPLLEHAIYLTALGLDRLEQVLRLLPDAGVTRFADLGVGPGVVSAEVLRAHPEATGVGYDLSEHCVRYATALRARRGITRRFEVAAGDARDLDCADGSYDLVIATEIIEHVPDPPRLVAEARRILTVGGRLIASVPLALPWGPHLTVFEDEASVVALFEAGFELDRVTRARLANGPELVFVAARAG